MKDPRYWRGEKFPNFHRGGAFSIPQEEKSPIPKEDDFPIPQGGAFTIPQEDEFPIPQEDEFPIPQEDEFPIPQGGAFTIPQEEKFSIPQEDASPQENTITLSDSNLNSYGIRRDIRHVSHYYNNENKNEINGIDKGEERGYRIQISKLLDEVALLIKTTEKKNDECREVLHDQYKASGPVHGN
uniref:Uncharacterized protein n=1 Tax=Chionoecetes opilio bacilliform virus TaxID=1825681 RepID=A0A1Q3DM24_9VIRU|nr:hypothetical protein SCV_118 [Chionoecetes opilio bacilliform virus]